MSDTRCDSPLSASASPPTPSPYTHYDDVCDAVTKGPVRSWTEIAALHPLRENAYHDQTLKNLTRIAEPASSCRMRVDNGDWLPAPTEGDEQGFRLYITYNHLMFAPQLRLECRFFNRAQPNAAPYHVVALEFPFSSQDERAIKQYHKTVESRPRITFTAQGATSTGLGKIHRSAFHLQSPERQILDCLGALQSDSPAEIELELDLSAMSDAARLELSKIDMRLPGGCGPQLTSLDKPEYFALDEGYAFDMTQGSLKKPLDLMESEVPFPMVPLAPLESFSSQKQAVMHLGYSAYHAELETRNSVRAWASATHKGAIFHLDHYDVPILAVRFSRTFPRLGGVREELKFKLPRELQSKATFKEDEGVVAFRDDENKKHSRELLLVLDEVSGLPPHDAAFIVLNNGGFARLEEQGKEIFKTDSLFPEFRDIDFAPDQSAPTLDAFLTTSKKLWDPSHSWITPLLNQDTSKLEEVDLTHHIDPAKVREADDWLFEWKDWNDEQEQLLRCIHTAKGCMILAKGVAGTGKSTLQTAISLYFAKLGFKVLVAPPANSNASHTAFEINTAIASDTAEDALTAPVSSEDDAVEGTAGPGTSSSEDDGDNPTCEVQSDEESGGRGTDFRGTVTPQATAPTARRLFASSLSQTLQELLRKQAEGRQDPHVDPLALMLEKLKDRKAGGRDATIEQAVIDEAERGRFKLFGKTDVGDIKPDTDVWELFRKHLRALRAGTFSWQDKVLRHELAEAYDLCRGHVIAATDILVTTTGNARSDDILQHWITSEDDYGIPYKGVIVMCDEAFKDSELGTWNAIMAAGEKTKGVFMFGDDFQLKPTNITSKGKLVFGQFNDQIDIALPARLVNHGFPYVYLKKQQRMHPCLSKFPNEEFYAGELRDSMRVNVPLETVMPGLADVLHGIIHCSYSTYGSGLCSDHYWETRTDEKARHHYFEVDGQRLCAPDGTSKYVQEHIDVFFKYIFPPLQEYWRGSTSKNLMIICAYTAAKVRYRAGIERMQKEQKLPAGWYPSIEELVPDSDASSSGSSDSGTLTPVTTTTNGIKKLNPETAYSRYLTIDAAQGQESTMVVLDGSWQHRDDIGFMTDRGRCNVAMTRARAVFWQIGGALECKRRYNQHRPLSPFPKLKHQMARQGRVHRIKL